MFMIGYDPRRLAIEWGKDDISRIYWLCSAYDGIQSECDTIHGKTSKQKCYKLRQAMLWIQKKICALIDDCHQKLAKWLCESYRIVLLPEFRTQEMIQWG